MEWKKFSNSMDDWQMSTQLIRERAKYLLENSLWTDCKFLVGSTVPYIQEFQAHKLILSMASPVFATMFNGGLPETQSPIEIVDVQPEAFKSMLEYIYTDTINMSSLGQACELCYVAKKYMLPHLQKNCVEFIWKDVDCNTALYAYEFAKLFEDAEILEKSMKLIRDKTTEILSKSATVNAISEQTLLDILDQDELNVSSEVYLFNVVHSWVLSKTINNDENETYDSEKLRATAKRAVRKIRFVTMSASEFAESAADSQLLTKDESYAILLNLSSVHNKHPLPEGMSECRIPRINPGQKVFCLSKKLYVQRPTKNSNVQISDGNLKDTLRFTTNENITLLGIQIPTQVMHISINMTSSDENITSVCIRDPWPVDGHHSSTPKLKYRESLIMFVKEIGNPTNSWFTHFSALVEYNLVANVIFTTPAIIKRGCEYELGVTRSKEGYYLIGAFDTTVEKCSDNVQFTLEGNSSTAFVSALIFTH